MARAAYLYYVLLFCEGGGGSFHWLLYPVVVILCLHAIYGVPFLGVLFGLICCDYECYSLTGILFVQVGLVAFLLENPRFYVEHVSGLKL